MCGGMKIVDLRKIFDDNEITTLVEMVRKEQSNQNYWLRNTQVLTGADYEIQKSIERLEVILQKLENIRNG
jgi:hypothetical protein